jgi:hypothetical protein
MAQPVSICHQERFVRDHTLDLNSARGRQNDLGLRGVDSDCQFPWCKSAKNHGVDRAQANMDMTASGIMGM